MSRYNLYNGAEKSKISATMATFMGNTSGSNKLVFSRNSNIALSVSFFTQSKESVQLKVLPLKEGNFRKTE